MNTTVAFYVIAALLGSAVALLGGGCPAADVSSTDPIQVSSTPHATVLHALPADLTALLNAPPVDAPTTGASLLANTSWSGTTDCAYTGDVNVLVSGPGTNPLSDNLYFDERGLPSAIAGLGYQFKRAHFTADGFDVAATFVMSSSMSGTLSSTACVVTLSGQRSADGQTLTGTRRWGVLESYGELTADIAIVETCNFTLSLDQ